MIVRWKFHHKGNCLATESLPNCYSEWQNFQFASNKPYGFGFFLQILSQIIAFKLKYVLFYQFYTKISTFSVTKCWVWLLPATLTSKCLPENDIMSKRHPDIMDELFNPHPHEKCKTIWATSWENLFMPYGNNKGASTVWSAPLLFASTSGFYIRNFKPLPSFCDCADQFESTLVANPEDRFSNNLFLWIPLCPSQSHGNSCPVCKKNIFSCPILHSLSESESKTVFLTIPYQVYTVRG